MENAIRNKIMDSKVIAIVRGIRSCQVCDLAGAILAGGLCCLEVTFDHKSEEGIQETLASIRLLSEQFSDTLCIGAGTVMSPEQVQLAKQAGARYIISPNTDEKVIRETKRLELVSIPGAMTATEVALAWEYGADIVKMFPAGILGPDYIKAIKAPLSHIPVTAVGGINAKNAMEFFQAGAIGIGVGGNLVSAKLVAEGKLDQITRAAREYVEALGL